MSGIILETTALSIRNKGGGWKTRNAYRPVTYIKPKINKDGTVTPQEVEGRQKFQEARKDTGSDYVVFNCPGCKKRNKRCAYEAKGVTAAGAISFLCNGCSREIEVAKPAGPMIQVPTLANAPGGHLVDPAGRPL